MHLEIELKKCGIYSSFSNNIYLNSFLTVNGHRPYIDIVFVLLDGSTIDLGMQKYFIYGWKIKTNLECPE